MTSLDLPARGRGRPANADRAARRQAILDAAIAEFLAKGYGGASLESIASTACATKRTLYAYFDDKAGLYGAAINQQHSYIQGFAVDPPSLEAAATAVVVSVFSDAAIGLHRLVLAEAHRFPEIAASFYEQGPQQAIRFLANLVPGDLEPAARADAAERLYSLLLGEPHRRRLLGLATVPTRGWVERHVRGVTTALGLNR